MSPLERLQRLVDSYPGSRVEIEGGRSFVIILAMKGGKGKDGTEIGRGQAGSIPDAIVALHASVLARSAQNFQNALQHYRTLGGDAEATARGEGGGE